MVPSSPAEGSAGNSHCLCGSGAVSGSRTEKKKNNIEVNVLKQYVVAEAIRCATF